MHPHWFGRRAQSSGVGVDHPTLPDQSASPAASQFEVFCPLWLCLNARRAACRRLDSSAVRCGGPRTPAIVQGIRSAGSGPSRGPGWRSCDDEDPVADSAKQWGSSGGPSQALGGPVADSARLLGWSSGGLSQGPGWRSCDDEDPVADLVRQWGSSGEPSWGPGWRSCGDVNLVADLVRHWGSTGGPSWGPGWRNCGDVCPARTHRR